MRFHPPRFVLWGMLCAVVVLAVSFASARQGTVTRTDGVKLTGDITHDDDEKVIVSIEGIEIAIPRDEVAKVEYLSGDDEGEQGDAGSSFDARYDRALKLFQENELDDAKAEVERMLMLGDEVPEEVRERLAVLRDAINAQLEQREGTENNQPDPQQQQQQNAGVEEEDLLTDGQINLIKVFEYTEGVDRRMRFRVPRDVVEEFLAKYRGQPGVPSTKDEENAFRRMSDKQQATAFMNARAYDLIEKIQITGNPQKIEVWSKYQNQMLLGGTGCAQSGCHAGVDKDGAAPGALRFVTRNPRSEQTLYTNFMIATQYRSSNNELLLDRNNPDRSLLVQHALPADDPGTVSPHPDVERSVAQFRPRDRQLQALTAWVKSLLPTADYEFDYEPSWAGKRPKSETEEEAVEPDEADAMDEPAP